MEQEWCKIERAATCTQICTYDVHKCNFADRPSFFQQNCGIGKRSAEANGIRGKERLVLKTAVFSGNQILLDTFFLNLAPAHPQRHTIQNQYPKPPHFPQL